MINKILKTAFFLGTLAIFFQNGDIITNSVKTGLELCYSAVIPSLFVFMVLSAVLSQSPGAKIVALPLWPYARLLKAKDAGKTAGYIFLALLGGFSAGAMMLGKIKQSCKDSNWLSVLAIAMVNNSPSFCIMTVGFILLGNKNIGVLLFVSLTLASLITARCYSHDIYMWVCRVFQLLMQRYFKIYKLSFFNFTDSSFGSNIHLQILCGKHGKKYIFNMLSVEYFAYKYTLPSIRICGR